MMEILFAFIAGLILGCMATFALFVAYTSGKHSQETLPPPETEPTKKRRRSMWD